MCDRCAQRQRRGEKRNVIAIHKDWLSEQIGSVGVSDDLPVVRSQMVRDVLWEVSGVERETIETLLKKAQGERTREVLGELLSKWGDPKRVKFREPRRKGISAEIILRRR